MHIFKGLHGLYLFILRRVKYLLMLIVPLILFSIIFIARYSEYDSGILALSFLHVLVSIPSGIIYLAVCFALANRVYRDNIATERLNEDI